MSHSHRPSHLVALVVLFLCPAQAAPVKLNPPLVAGGNVSKFKTSPDGQRVVYMADQDVDQRFELYSVAVGGGPVVRLNDPLPPGGIIYDFEISPDSAHVIYQAFQQSNWIDFYSVPIAGGNSVLLSPLAGSVSGLALITADSTRVVFSEDNRIYAVPIMGGIPTLVSYGSYPRWLTPDGTSVLFGGYHAICIAPLTGGPCTLIHPAEPPNDGSKTHAIVFSEDGSRLVFERIQNTAPQSFMRYQMLYSYLVTGVFAESYGPTTTGCCPLRFVGFTPVPVGGDSWAVWSEPDRIRSRAHDGGPTITLASGAVYDVQISGDPSRILYVLSSGPDDHLYVVPVMGGASTDLSGPTHTISSVTSSANGEWAVYRAGHLYAVPLGGGTPHQVSDGGSPLLVTSDFRVSPLSTTVIYRQDREVDGRYDLVAASLFGGTPVTLSDLQTPSGDVAADWSFTTDGHSVIYRADQETDGVDELYRATIVFCPDGETLDFDGDGVCTGDNCPTTPNDQHDGDADGLGDACDNCPVHSDPDQQDTDGDALGDICDTCPLDAANDEDGDGRCANADNCPAVANGSQTNADADAFGDACDPCPLDAANDADGDAVCANADNCPSAHNPDQEDADEDATGDACDACPVDPANDADGDWVCGNLDNCPIADNPNQADTDGDAIGNACDACPADPANDADGDSVCGNLDNCPIANPDQADSDVTYAVLQWGATASASSEFGPDLYSAMQATGAPDSAAYCGDAATRWTPAADGTDPEWLEVGYASPVRARGIRMRESSCNCTGAVLPPGGFVYRVELRDTAGALHTVWSATDGTACADEFAPSWSLTPYAVTAVRVHTQVVDYEEIDAVELVGHGATASALPDGVGDACDNCSQFHNPGQEHLVFFEPLLAVDGDHLSWAAAFDVTFVRGTLGDVSSYAFTDTGSLAGATALDITSDDPAAGTGRYYLVRLGGACGSWQSTTGAEPLRDSALP